MLLAGSKCYGIRSARGRGLASLTEPRPWLRRPPTNYSGQALEAKPPLSDELELSSSKSELTTSAAHPQPGKQEEGIDPSYLLACRVEWERRQATGAAWELIAASRSSHSDTRAQARALLASSPYLGGSGAVGGVGCDKLKVGSHLEADVMDPHEFDLSEKCDECTRTQGGFYCGFSPTVLRALHHVSHKSTMPAGTILFVEGQSPRGAFIVCSGRVNLSTTSREGKVLILKTVETGEALGLSAAISGVGYEVTAETSTPCQLNFIDRRHLLELLQAHPEVGLQTALSLSRDFQSAYRDIHDLVLTRSSAGKLARLLLSQSAHPDPETVEIRIPSFMTHEEMAHRIGSSRETVTRLLSDLKRKQLIRLEGPTMVIRNRPALEALAV